MEVNSKQINQLIYCAKEQLSHNKEILNPWAESRMLLAHTLGIDIENLFIDYFNKVSKENYYKFFSLINRRQKFEPIAYILKYKEFFSRKFFTNRNVLIPRKDSETLIEAILQDFNKFQNLDILDLGIGSGCLLITLLMEFPYSYGIGIDISKSALKVSLKNSILYNLENRITLLQGDWFNNLDIINKFDIIISNPPYISFNDINLISKEILFYEPLNALLAYKNGLKHYYTIAKYAKIFLKNKGRVYVEIGYNQLNHVINIFQSQGYKFLKKYKDLSQYYRCCCFIYNLS